MGKTSPPIRLLSVLVIWAAYSSLIKLFWGFYSSANPLLYWALERFIPDHRSLFYVLLYSHDLLLNVLLAFPVGVLLRTVYREGVWAAVIGAALILSLLEYRRLIVSAGAGPEFFQSFGSIFGLAISLGLLPLVYSLAGFLRKNHAA